MIGVQPKYSRKAECAGGATKTSEYLAQRREDAKESIVISNGERNLT